MNTKKILNFIDERIKIWESDLIDEDDIIREDILEELNQMRNYICIHG